MQKTERVPLCELPYCPAPTDPDWHRCLVCQSPQIDHDHVLGRGKKLTNDPRWIVPLCREHHEKVTKHEWTRGVIGGPNDNALLCHEPRFYILDERGETIFDDVLPWMQSADTDGGELSSRGDYSEGFPAPPSLPVDFQRWQEVGQSLKDIVKRLPWLLGDWLVFGERFGEEAWQFIDGLFVNEQSVAQYERVARAFPPEARRDDLSWSVHRRLAYTIDTPEERASWLEKTADEGWTRDELALQLKGVTGVRETHACPDCGAVHGVKE